MTGCLSLFNIGQVSVPAVPIWPRLDFDFHFISPQRESSDAALPYVYKNLGQSSNGFFRIALSLGTSCKTPSVCLDMAEQCRAVNLLAALHNQIREKELQNATD